MPFVASGSYGCVFRPHLACKGKHPLSSKKGTVGKVFEDHSEFENEREMFEKVRQIDPHGLFTLPLLGECETRDRPRRSDRIEDCPLIDMSRSTSYDQLIIPDGGISLSAKCQDKPLSRSTFWRMVPLLVPILEGLVTLKGHGQVHQDIKPENIMYKKGRLYLIDFGIMSEAKKIYIHGNGMLGADYPYFPPEYKLFSAPKGQAVDRFISSFLENFTFSIKIAGSHANIPRLMEEALDIDLTEALADLHASPQFDPSKVDVYQLGMVIFMMYISCGLHKARRPTPRTAAARTLILGMLIPSPRERLSPEEALILLKEMVGKPRHTKPRASSGSSLSRR